MPTFRVPDMQCDGCVRAIATAVRAVAPAATTQADLETHLVRVTGPADTDALNEALREAGFSPEPWPS